MKLKNILIFTLVFGLAILSSCKKDNSIDDNTDINDLNISDSFEFATTKTITITINDFENGARYDIYTINSVEPDDVIYTSTDTTVVIDDLNQLVASGFISDGSFITSISVPTYHNNVFIMRGKQGVFHGENVEILSDEINYTFSQKKSSRIVTNDMLYAVNSSNTEIYSIDVETGILDIVGNMPYKSIANAADKINNRIYAANNKAPFQLGYYDLTTSTFTVTGNFSWNFPRMDYNPDDGLLYISKNNKLYKVNPTNAQILQTYSIVGLHNHTYCDIAFAPDGSLFIGAKLGIYSSVFNGSTINVTRISDATLPTNITSLAVASDGNLFTSVSDAKGKIIEFDPETGGWKYLSISGNVKINDFGIIRYVEPTWQDADGDGIPDVQDDYPNDFDRAFNNYFPGKNERATIAFEDLWPSKGDYDFNDLVISYNINRITNAANNVVEIDAKFNPVHNGATFINGFAFQLPFEASAVESVTGYNLTGASVVLDANGTITGHNYASIPVFDQTIPNLGATLNITVKFINPVDPVTLGNAPFNPYLIKDEIIDMEIHLPDMAPSNVMDLAYFGTEDDDSNPLTGRYYKTVNNLPWAINIIYDFTWPLESKEITKGYLKFGDWAESGGTLFPDWYKDLSGYRNNEFLDTQKK